MDHFRAYIVALVAALGPVQGSTGEEPPEFGVPSVTADSGVPATNEDWLKPGLQPGRAPRLRLLGLPCGFLQEPIGIEDDSASADAASLADDGVVVALGAYNPAFEWRWPGEGVGLGYCKLYSQVQVLDLGASSLSLGLEALRPAGQEVGGRADGPTLVNPSVAWFHDVGDGVALHGFVGQHIQANSHWSENLDRGLRCGLAWQYPLLFAEDDPEQGLFFFVQGLGGYRADTERAANRAAWDLVPGLHWRVNSNCWMSLGASRYSLFTCSWQF